MRSLQFIVTHETIEGCCPNETSAYDTGFEISALVDHRRSFRLITAKRASLYTWQVTDHFANQTWRLRRRYKSDAVSLCLYLATKAWNNEQRQLTHRTGL